MSTFSKKLTIRTGHRVQFGLHKSTPALPDGASVAVIVQPHV
jgi:hypothetical protein